MSHSHEVCHWVFCFHPLHATSADKIFGFPEYLTAVALLALIYTITDARYKFRIAIAPGHLYGSTFLLLIAIGFGSLLTGLWPAEHWWVPDTVGLSLVLMEVIWGALFLGALVTWMWYAFIRPSTFGRRNARRFRDVLVNYVVRCNDDEMRILASELGRSATQLVKLAKTNTEIQVEQASGRKRRWMLSGHYAHYILLTIGNRRICKEIVRSSPATAKLLFDSVSKANKYDLPLAQFARNISGEAIRWEGSFLYDEAEGFDSGLLGYVKPITKAVYGNYPLIEALAHKVGSPLDVLYRDRCTWKAPQWEAYCRGVLVALAACLDQGWTENSTPVFGRAIESIKEAYHDINEMNGRDDGYESDAYQKLKVAVEFVVQATTLLDRAAHPPQAYRHRNHKGPKNIYDHLAEMIEDMCFWASRVRGPAMTSWMVQYNTIWSELFGFEDGPAWRIVRSKAARVLYDEIAHLNARPSYKGARILGYCLNVLGVTRGPHPPRGQFGRAEWALRAAVQAWTKKEYWAFHLAYPKVADTALLGSITLDAPNHRLVKTYNETIHNQAPYRYLDLDIPPTLSAPPAAPQPAPALPTPPE